MYNTQRNFAETILSIENFTTEIFTEFCKAIIRFAKILKFKDFYCMHPKRKRTVLQGFQCLEKVVMNFKYFNDLYEP